MNYLEKTKESYNSYYNQYKAAWCKKSGLPMYSKNDWDKIERDELYSVTRAQRARVAIDTTVCAWQTDIYRFSKERSNNEHHRKKTINHRANRRP